MSSYLSTVITNEPDVCAIKIACTVSENNSNAVTKIAIKRKLSSDSTWIALTDVNISDITDRHFEIYDTVVKATNIYDYMLLPCSGDNDIPLLSDIIYGTKCKFQAFYFSNDTETYICDVLPSYTQSNTSQVSYVNTMSGRTPFRVKNSSNIYAKGSFAGTFMPKDANGIYTLDGLGEYVRNVIDFFINGSPILFKTNDGEAWMIGVDEEISKSVASYPDAPEISFSWTEIGEVPVSRMLESGDL